MDIEDIRAVVRGRRLARGRNMAVAGVSTDSRAVSMNELFVALPGERFDGHDFLAQAATDGAAAALVRLDRELDAESLGAFPGGVIGVDDTVQALGELAAEHRRRAGATVVGITGSNGKTTVKRMVHHILTRRLQGSCSPKSFNNAIGVPLTLLAVSPGDDYVVCEIGTSAPGEIASLGRMAVPDVAVITSVGPTHLAQLGSLMGVATEKASLLGCLADGGLAVVNADSPELARAMNGYAARAVTFGEADEAMVRLTGYEPLERGCRFELNGRLCVELPVPGRHNAINALAAIAAAQRLGFSQEDAAEAMGDFAGVEMRLQWVRVGGLTIINDAYNANPASMEAAADVLAGAGPGRKVFMAGDMLELGEDAQRLHVRTGRRIARRRVDLLIGIGPLGRYMAQGALETGVAAREFGDVDSAAAVLEELLRPGDTVVLKGSRAMAMERLIEPVRRLFAPCDSRLP